MCCAGIGTELPLRPERSCSEQRQQDEPGSAHPPLYNGLYTNDYGFFLGMTAAGKTVPRSVAETGGASTAVSACRRMSNAALAGAPLATSAFTSVPSAASCCDEA